MRIPSKRAGLSLSGLSLSGPSLSGPSLSGLNPCSAIRIPRAGSLRHWVLGLMIGLTLTAPGRAWTAQFKEAPGAPEKGGDETDMILGLIHANTLFFVVLGVFGFFWFLFGGGRKAKVGRKGH